MDGDKPILYKNTYVALNFLRLKITKVGYFWKLSDFLGYKVLTNNYEKNTKYSLNGKNNLLKYVIS